MTGRFGTGRNGGNGRNTAATALGGADTFTHGDIVIDVADRHVRKAGVEVPLTIREYSILLTLIENRGRILSRLQLEESLYGWGEEVESNAIQVHIHHLRKKLGRDLIRTHRRRRMNSPPVWSLRNALFRWLIGLTLALWALSAVIVYVEADNESQELFDQSLEETAHLLLSLAEYEVREHGSASPIIVAVPAERNHRQYLLYQIWDDQVELGKDLGAADQPIWPHADSGMRWLDSADGRQRVYASWSNSRQLQIQVAEPVTHRKDISHRFAYKLAGFALALVALAALAIWWSVRRLFRGLQQSTGEVASRTPNDLAAVSLAGVPREVLPLLQAINRLFERVRRAMEREQRFTADAAHELRTPLAAIKTNLQVIQRARNDAERDEFVSALGVSVDRASRL
eukprot:gene9812-9623_t